MESSELLYATIREIALNYSESRTQSLYFIIKDIEIDFVNKNSVRPDLSPDFSRALGVPCALHGKQEQATWCRSQHFRNACHVGDKRNNNIN